MKQRVKFNIKNLYDVIKCPISTMIMFDPVVADDGITYERIFIDKWLKKNSISPKTGVKMTKKLVPNDATKILISNFLNDNAHLCGEQYIPKMCHIEFINDIKQIINSKDFIKLKNYCEFSSKYFLKNNGNLICLLCSASLEIQKHVVNETTNINYCNNTGNTIMHYFASHGRMEILQYLIEKGATMEKENIHGRKPIHFACEHNTNNDAIKYIIDNSIDLECDDKNLYRPIHCLCINPNIDTETVIYLIEKGINLNYSENNERRAIHLICQGDNNELIKYILDTDPDLDFPDSNGWRPIHYLCSGHQVDIIEYAIGKNIDLECETNDGFKPIHMLAKPSTLTLIKLLIEKGVQVTNIPYVETDGIPPLESESSGDNENETEIETNDENETEAETNNNLEIETIINENENQTNNENVAETEAENETETNNDETKAETNNNNNSEIETEIPTNDSRSDEVD